MAKLKKGSSVIERSPKTLLLTGLLLIAVGMGYLVVGEIVGAAIKNQGSASDFIIGAVITIFVWLLPVGLVGIWLVGKTYKTVNNQSIKNTTIVLCVLIAIALFIRGLLVV